MKVALAQVTIPTGTATVDVTDSNISSDWQGAICFGGAPTANNTTTASSAFYIGACDAGGRNVCVAHTAQDATAGAGAGTVLTASACAQNVTSSGGIVTNLAYSSTLSNGVRLTTVNGGAGSRFCNVLLFSGSDIQFGVNSSHLAAASASVVLNHNLTVTPDLVIVLSSMTANALGTGGSNPNGISVGFYDGTNSISWSNGVVNAANPTNVAARCGVSSSLGEQINNSLADLGSWTISAVGTTSVTLTRGNTSSAQNVAIIAIGHNTGFNASAVAYTDTTPTVTGNNTPSGSTTIPPQVWLNMPTRLTSTSLTHNDTAGSWGFCVAANNPSLGTQQACSAGSFEYNVATSVAKSYTQITEASLTLTDTGTVAFNSTLNSWNASGITENVGTTTGTAGERINLLYGTQPVPGAPATILYERRYVHYYIT